MKQSWISRLATGLIGSAIAYLVAFLPERVKEQKPFSDFQSNAAHAVSGLTECVMGLVLFVYGYGQFAGRLGQTTSQALAVSKVSDSIPREQMSAIGVGGYVLYLFHPIAIISMFLAFEGYTRAVSACMADRRHGITVLWILHKIYTLTKTKRQDALLRKQLGPYEPDSIFKNDAAGTLLVISVEDKDWRDRQVTQYEEEFFVLSAKDFVRKGRYFRYQYTFRRMHPGEIVRGRIVYLSADSAGILLS